MNNKMQIICKKHPSFPVVFICQKSQCQFGNMLCQQCISQNPNHRIEHKTLFCTIQEFLSTQNGTTKTVLVPQINDCLSDLDKRIKEYQSLIDRDQKEIEGDIAQFFNLFFQISQKCKDQLKELVSKDLNDNIQRAKTLRQNFEDLLKNEQKQKDNTNLFNAIFKSDQDRELPVTEQSILQIISKNNPLNQLKSDILSNINVVNYAMSPQSIRPKYKSTIYQQQQLNMLKADFEQTLLCLYQKLGDLTNDNQTVEDLKKSVYQYSSVDNSLKSSQIISLSASQTFNSTQGFKQQLTTRTQNKPVMTINLIDQFPRLPQRINDILQQIGQLPRPTSDSILSGLDQVGPSQFSDGVYYEGQIVNNQRHGWGRAIIGNQYYEGYWRANQPNGFGRLISTAGDIYEGLTVNAKAHGRGKFQSAGYYYEGEWVEDLRENQGIEHTELFKYQGQFKQNKKHGQGTLFINGNKYSGQFVNGILTGEATIEYGNGDKYFGEVQTIDQNIKRQGRGIYQWSDGRKYEGEYLADLEHGIGLFIWPDDWMYKGQWAQGVQHGKGVQVSPQGNEKEGIWANGAFQSWLE